MVLLLRRTMVHVGPGLPREIELPLRPNAQGPQPMVHIGRDPTSNDAVLICAHLSRNHAVFTLIGDEPVLRDLGTVNGTYVRGPLAAPPRPAGGPLALRTRAWRAAPHGGGLPLRGSGVAQARALRSGAKRCYFPFGPLCVLAHPVPVQLRHRDLRARDLQQPLAWPGPGVATRRSP